MTFSFWPNTKSTNKSNFDNFLKNSQSANCQAMKNVDNSVNSIETGDIVAGDDCNIVLGNIVSKQTLQCDMKAIAKSIATQANDQSAESKAAILQTANIEANNEVGFTNQLSNYFMDQNMCTQTNGNRGGCLNFVAATVLSKLKILFLEWLTPLIYTVLCSLGRTTLAKGGGQPALESDTRHPMGGGDGCKAPY